MDVYQELLQFKDRMIDTNVDTAEETATREARLEMKETDLVLLKAERERLRRRFRYWNDRYQRLADA